MATSADHVKLDWPWTQRWLSQIRAASGFYGIPGYLIAGIMSRESGAGRLLKPPGPAGTGDYGHGRGLMQIDDRWHEFARTGAWRDPLANIKYGTQLLANYRSSALKKGVPQEHALRVALAGYNCGLGNALKSYQAGGINNVDARTTGRNYSKDVLTRAALFKPLIPDTTEKKTLQALLVALLMLKIF